MKKDGGKGKNKTKETKNVSPSGCKIDFSAKGGGDMIHLHNIYACIM